MGTSSRKINSNDRLVFDTTGTVTGIKSGGKEAKIASLSTSPAVPEQYLLADGAKISAAVYDASHFGFYPAVRTWPTAEQT